MDDAATFVAGTPCLELTNTINNWHHPRHDTLKDPESAAGWASIVLDVEIESLSDATTEELRALRAQMREIFLTVARHADPKAGDLIRLMDCYRRGLATARLESAEGRYELAWADVSTAVAAPFSADAVRLLREGPLGRVGECPGCGWLFLDTSKNARRTWCSMRTCGAREKAKRHYRRTHPRP